MVLSLGTGAKVGAFFMQPSLWTMKALKNYSYYCEIRDKSCKKNCESAFLPGEIPENCTGDSLGYINCANTATGKCYQDNCKNLVCLQDGSCYCSGIDSPDAKALCDYECKSLVFVCNKTSWQCEVKNPNCSSLSVGMVGACDSLEKKCTLVSANMDNCYDSLGACEKKCCDTRILGKLTINSPLGTIDNPKVFLTAEKIKFSWNKSSETSVLKEYKIEIRKNDVNNTLFKEAIISDSGNMEYEINRSEFRDDISLYYWTVRPINIHCRSKGVSDIAGVVSDRQYFRLNYKPQILSAKIVDKNGAPIVCKDFEEGKIVVEATDKNKKDLDKLNVFMTDMSKINSSFSPFVYDDGEENRAKIETKMFSRSDICDCSYLRVQVVDKQGENNESGLIDYFYVNKEFCSKDCVINLPWFWVKGAGVMSGGDIKNNVPEKSFMSQKFGEMSNSWIVSGGGIEKGKGEYGEVRNWYKSEIDVLKKGGIKDFMLKMEKLDYDKSSFELVFGDYKINSNINKMVFVDGDVEVEGDVIINGGLYVTGNIKIKGNLGVEYNPLLLKKLPEEITKVIRNWRQF